MFQLNSVCIKVYLSSTETLIFLIWKGIPIQILIEYRHYMVKYELW